MSKRPPIAVFANQGSPQAAMFRDAVAEVGGTPMVFDIQLGGPARPAMTMGGGRALWEGVDFSAIDAVHIRCTAPNTLPAVPPLMNASSYNEWRGKYLREQEYQSAAHAFFEYLSGLGKLVINPLTSAYIDHDTKAQLYEKLRANGFPSPRTLTSNDPGRAYAFVESCREVVVKPSIGVGSTRVISVDDRARLEELASCPVMMQERIVGDTLRVHIVGDSVVLALRIISDGGVDSRTDTKRFEYVKLADSEERRIVQANRLLGLHYAAWDIVEARDGGYVYLDCNPGPFVMWIGSALVRALFLQLASYMLTYVRTGSLAEAASQVVAWKPGGK